LYIKDIYSTVIYKTEEEYKGKENVIIDGLEDCIVVIPFPIKSLYIKNVMDCKIYAGAVSGASFINGAKRC
jgi:ribosomal protein L14E/L6E/L27E